MLKQEDKQKHIWYSFAIFIGCTFVFSVVSSFFLTLTVGVGKEIWDRYYGSGFCWYDMIANMIGIILGGFVLAVQAFYVSYMSAILSQG